MKATFKSSSVENVKPENYRFYKITQGAYYLGLGGASAIGVHFPMA